MNRKAIFLILSISFLSCSMSNKNTINETEEKYLKSLELLENNEKVLIFSTSLNIEKSGNFVSTKRIASYWLEDIKPEKSYKDFALFSEIERIESEDNTKSWTHSSSLTIFKKDGSNFKVYIDGGKEKYDNFKKIAIDNWKNNKGHFKKNGNREEI